MTGYRKLPAQKRKFVDLIVRRMRPTEAIRQIRPHLKRPDVLAAKWKAELKEIIREREEEAMEEAGITNAQILLGLAYTADFDIRKLVHEDGTPKKIHELDDETARILQGVEVEHIAGREGGTQLLRTKFRLPSRIEARKLLGQHKKLFTQKHEHELGEKTLEQLIAASNAAKDGEE